MLLIIFFFLPNVVSKHRKLLNLFFSTYEFITGAKSSRVAIFAMFSVIVIAVFSGSSKASPASDFDDDGFFLTSHPEFHQAYSGEEKENDEDYDSYNEDEDDYHGYDGYDEDNDDGLDTEDVDSEEDEIHEIDLEKRINEFIANVYKKWSEELIAERLLCLEPPS